MNLKGFIEKRNGILAKMREIAEKLEKETRAMTEEEKNSYAALKQELAGVDEAIRALQETGDIPDAPQTPETRAAEETAFLRYLRGEERALGTSANGAIIPTTIANRILEEIKQLCPMYQLVTVYNVVGNLSFPRYTDSTGNAIAAAYVDDLTSLTESAGSFTVVTLGSYISGALAKVSKSLMNNTTFDLVGYVIRRIAQAIVEFLNHELLIGTSGKMVGAVSATQEVPAGAATYVTGDDLIDLQMAVPAMYHKDAVWVMNPATLAAVRKLKDSNGDYLLTRDLTEGFVWRLLGNKVYVDENMADIGAGAKPIVYGDMSGVYLKLSHGIDVQVLTEKYADQHAVGVVGYVECDSNIVEPQKLAVLEMAATDPVPPSPQ